MDRRKFIKKGMFGGAGILVASNFNNSFAWGKTNSNKSNTILAGTGKLQENWWESEPLRIVELEEGYKFAEKADTGNNPMSQCENQFIYKQKSKKY